MSTQPMMISAPDRGFSPLPPVAEATRAASTGLLVVALGLAVAYGAAPSQRPWLAADNGLTDAATAVVLAVTVVVGCWAIHRIPRAGAWRWLLPTTALLGFVDEVYSGGSFLGIRAPRLGSVTVDGIPALLAAGQDLAQTRLGLSPLDLAAAAALAAALGAFVLARRRRATRAAAWLADRPPAVHLVAAGTLAMAAVALDLFGELAVLRFMEEWLELAAAALLFRGSLLIPRREPQALGWRQRLRPWLENDRARQVMPSAALRKPEP